MNAQVKGGLSIVLGVLGMYSMSLLENYTSNVLVIILIGVVFSASAIYLGKRAQKEGSSGMGITGQVLGILGIITVLLPLLFLFRSGSSPFN